MTCGERRVGPRCEDRGAPFGCFPMMVESSTRPARRRSLAPGSPPRAMSYLPPRPTGKGRRYLLSALAPNPTKSCCRVTAPATFFVGTNASSYRSRKREARHCFTRWATGEDSSPERGKDGLRWTNQGKPSSEMGPAAGRWRRASGAADGGRSRASSGFRPPGAFRMLRRLRHTCCSSRWRRPLPRPRSPAKRLRETTWGSHSRLCASPLLPPSEARSFSRWAASIAQPSSAANAVGGTARVSIFYAMLPTPIAGATATRRIRLLTPSLPAAHECAGRRRVPDGRTRRSDCLRARQQPCRRRGQAPRHRRAPP